MWTLGVLSVLQDSLTAHKTSAGDKTVINVKEELSLLHVEFMSQGNLGEGTLGR